MKLIGWYGFSYHRTCPYDCPVPYFYSWQDRYICANPNTVSDMNRICLLSSRTLLRGSNLMTPCNHSHIHSNSDTLADTNCICCIKKAPVIYESIASNINVLSTKETPRGYVRWFYSFHPKKSQYLPTDPSGNEIRRTEAIYHDVTNCPFKFSLQRGTTLLLDPNLHHFELSILVQLAA